MQKIRKVFFCVAVLVAAPFVLVLLAYVAAKTEEVMGELRDY